MEELQILKDSVSVQPYVTAVRTAADLNKSSLGFLPTSVFSEYARRGKLWVALSKSGDYLGHLLFDLKYPKATVIQMYCEPSVRRVGVATALISSLKKSLTDDDYLSIRASVAEDLAAANDFWERQGFYIQSRKLGGQTTGRTIIVRIHELSTPQLFERSGMDATGSDSLGLAQVASADPPLYLLDLNIIFDLIKRREQHGVAARLFRAAHSGECRLAISDEMQRELQREALNPQTDPMLCLIDSLPCVQLPASDYAKEILRYVASTVFPEKAYPGQLSKNDLSDVSHVSTAILCQLAGFITRDQRILVAASKIEEKYQLQILAPTEFGAADMSHGHASELDVGGDSRVRVITYNAAHYERVRILIESCSVLPNEIISLWLPRGANDGAAANLVAQIGEDIVGYAVASRFEPRTKVTKIRCIVDESSAHASEIARVLLLKVMGTNVKSTSSLFQLSLPARQASFREVAYSLGFRASGKTNDLLKVAAGTALMDANWADVCASLSDSAGLRLPAQTPAWTSHHQKIEVRCPDGNKRFVRLDVLEKLLSPAIFALPGRAAVIVPIQPKYSEALLGTSRQLSFAPLMQLEASVSRMYLADPRSLNRYTKGGLVLFYESGAAGERAVVAVARILDVYLMQRDEASEESLKSSVLRPNSIREIGKSLTKSVCVFDNVVKFPSSVGLKKLQSLGISASRLITASKISDIQLKGILSEGFIGIGE